MFVNTLSADDRYSLLNRDNLTQRIQMQLSQQEKASSQFFCLFEMDMKFVTFPKKE